LLLTGQYGVRTGWYNNRHRPGAPEEGTSDYDLGARLTFADVLKSRGYATALAGKWQLSGRWPDLVRECGFDEYCIWAQPEDLPPGVEHTGAFKEEGGLTARYWNPCLLRNGEYRPTGADDYGPDRFVDFLTDFLRRHREDAFLAYYAMCLPHRPWGPTPDPADPAERTSRGLKNNLAYLDFLVGRLVSELEALERRADTIVFFLGDNAAVGEGKATPTERGCHVPLIVNAPGLVRSGVVSPALVDLSDVFPTLADLAGAELPATPVLDGQSFAPILLGEDGGGRDWIFSYVHDRRVLRDRRWLLEGDGRFFDCGTRRDGRGYRDVSRSSEPEVVAARARFEEILLGLPAPEGLAPCAELEEAWTRESWSPGAGGS
jgi:arylsulfatase A-like enzyme